MHFTADLSLGQLLIIATMIGMAVKVGWRLGTFETILKEHAQTFHEHANRLDRYEDALTHVVQDLQKVIGRIDGQLESHRP